jgi:hypothetical protein
MSPYQIAFYTLWLAHPVLELAVIYFLWKRSLRREFPVFFIYIITQVVIFCAVFFVAYNGSQHSYGSFLPVVQWGTILVSTVLGFRVLHEIFSDVMRPYHTLNDLGAVLFRWAAIVMVLVGVVVAASAQGDASPLDQAFIVVQRCVRMAQVGLVLFLLVFSSYLGVTWRHRSFGLSLGFGTFATVELLIAPLLASGRRYLSQSTADLLNMVAWDCALAIWIFYTYRESTVRESGSRMIRSQRWDRTLTELQHPVPAESLIPMFESMVERALNRAPAGDPNAKNDEPKSMVERMTAGK